MVDVARLGIEAIGNSGFLAYLQNLNVERIVVELSQSNDTMSLSLRSDVKTEQIARTSAAGLRAAVQVGQMQSKVEDEKYLLAHTIVKSEGSSFTIHIAIPTCKAKELLIRDPSN